MRRREFAAALIGCALAPLVDVKTLTAGQRVMLVSYPDVNRVGKAMTVVGPVARSGKLNQHYRPSETLYRLSARGLILDVYADEVQVLTR